MNRRKRFAPLSRLGLILPLLGLLAAALFFAGPQPAAQADHDPPVPTPAAPTGVGERIVYDTGIVLEWDPPPAGSQVHYYLIEIRLYEEDDWRSTTYSAFTPPRNGKLRGGFHDLEQNTVYELRISACLDPNLGEEHLAGERCSSPAPAVHPPDHPNPQLHGRHMVIRTPTTAPSPPQNLVATPGEQAGLSDTTARLTWDAPASDGGKSISGYDVGHREYSADISNPDFYDNNQWTLTACPPPTATNRRCDAPGLDAAKEYIFRVSATFARSTQSTQRWEYVVLPRRPDRPANLTASEVGADRVTLSWPAAGGGTDLYPIQDYELQYRKNSVSDWTDAGTTANTTAVIRGLEPNTIYHFRVRTSTVRYVLIRHEYKERGRVSDFRASGSVTTLAASAHVSTSPSPLTEANLDGATLTIDLAGVQWQITAGGVPHRYLIDNGDPDDPSDDSPPVHIDRVQRVSDSRVVLTLGYWPNNPKYDFDDDAQLKLKLPADLHTHTEDFTVSVPVTAIDEQTPGRVTGVTASGGPNNITVSWNPVAGATGYKVQWKLSNGSYDESRQGITRGTSATIPDLSYNTLYDVRVAAFKLKADPTDGDWSTSARVRTANVNLFLTPSRTCESDAAGHRRPGGVWHKEHWL